MTSQCAHVQGVSSSIGSGVCLNVETVAGSASFGCGSIVITIGFGFATM